MRIQFFISGTGVYGGLKAVFEYANRLARRGHYLSIVLLCESFRSFLKARLAGTLGIKKSRISWFPVEVPVIPVYDRWGRFSLPSADVRVATYWKTAQFLHHLSSVPWVYFVQHREDLWAGDPEEIQETYHYSGKIVVLSSWIQEGLKKSFSQESEVLVTPVNPEHVYPSSAVRTQFSPKEFRIGLLYHERPWKGVADAMEAYRQLKTHLLSANAVIEFQPQLVFLSGNPLSETFLLKYGLEKTDYEVWVNPRQSELYRYYNSLDLYLCPSWYEGLGMPAMEAMACQIPVLTTDNGGCREYALHGKTAWVVPPRDPRAMAEALEFLICRPALRQDLARRGYEKVSTWTWEKQVSRFEQICLDLLSPRKN